jgi:NTE family protein
LASIGVLDELTQSGVSVDRIGGAGLGALVAGMFALGLPPGEMTRRCHDEFVVRHAFRDYTVPRVALLRGRRFSSMLDRVFGDVRVEQLSRPFFCLSADLGTANVVVHRRGRLAAAIAASTALPGVLPPVIDEDRVLFDGSVLDNVPVTVLAEEDEGPVVAVDVRLRPWEGRGKSNRSLPGIVDTISRAAALGGSQNQAESHRRALLVLEPDPPERRQLDFERLDEIVEAGRETVRAALADNPWLVGGGARSE